MPIVVNSKFRPFSYQEMLQPVLMSAQAHKELEDQYAELGAKASIWERLKDSEIDKDVYQQYKGYSDALRESSNQLAQTGLTPSSRRAMLDMRSRYAQDIIPIEQAYAERDRQMKLQQEMMLKDPTHMYRVNAGQIGLRNYINGNYDALTDNYSGALLAQQASQIASNLKNALTDRGKLRSLGLPYQYEREIQKGFTMEQVDKAIRGDADANPILTKVIDQVLEGSGISKWDNYNDIKDKVRGYIGQGIYSAVGQTEYKDYKDDYSMQLGLLRAKHAMDNTPQPYTRTQLRGNPYNLDSRLDMGKSQSEHNEYAKYFDKNGNITPEGIKEYNRIEIRGGTSNTGYVQQIRVPSEFKRFMDKLNGGKPINVNIGMQDPYGTFRDLYAANQQRLNNEGVVNADTYRNKAFDVQFKNQDIVRQALTTGKNNGKFDTYEYTKNGYQKTGSIDLNSKDFDKAGFAGEYGLQGNFVVVTDKKGKSHRIPLSMVNSNLNNSITYALKHANSLYYDDNGLPYTNEQLEADINNGRGGYTKLIDEIYKELNSAYDNFGAAFEQLQTEPYKVSGGLH